MTDSSTMQDHLKSRRRRLETDLLGHPQRRFFSPVYLVQYRVTLPLLRRYTRGRLIDLGCGDMPFKAALSDQLDQYDSLDFFPRRDDLTYVADVQAMPAVPDGQYDSAICLEVLEHVPDPFRAAREIHRILRPGGVLVLSVPHLSRLHDLPHDYYRYTCHGLDYLLTQAGFEVLEMHERGGLFTFLGHQLSTVLLGLVWSWPGVRQVIWFLNAWLVTRFSVWLDERLNRGGLFTTGYTAVAVKPVGREAK